MKKQLKIRLDLSPVLKKKNVVFESNMIDCLFRESL